MLDAFFAITNAYYTAQSLYSITLGRVAQSVTCLATDACLTADPVVLSLIPAQSHTLVEIDHEIFSTVILLPSAESFKKGCCFCLFDLLFDLILYVPVNNLSVTWGQVFLD